jgi:monovalent cation:H+ antiporter, CPA1 family
MALPSILLALTGLLTVIGLAQPVANRLRLPYSVVLALVGVILAAGSAVLLQAPSGAPLTAAAAAISDLPLTSAAFLNIFLPILLFQAAFTLDTNRMADDAAPILLLAVVAVAVTTAVVGGLLAPVSGESLVVCLMVGALVATTDPSAVVAIFRDLGAPERLTRLVEGESLLNDAAAIAIFGLLLDFLVSGTEPGGGEAVVSFLIVFLGGAATGAVFARLFLALMGPMRDLRTAQVTMTLALPYAAFLVADRILEVSGVDAAVCAGLVMSSAGRRRIDPDTWNHLEDVWHQLAFWAGSLIFVLAAILVPRLMGDLSFWQLFLVLVVAVAALIARALVLFGLLPLLTAIRLSERVANPHKAVILWGGLRGAVTLALALAVTENPHLAEPTKTFVAVLATGYVLTTLFVNGLTLRPLIRLLGIDRLSPLDLALRRQVVTLSLESALDAAGGTAADYGIPDPVAAGAAAAYREVRTSSSSTTEEPAVPDRHRFRIGLVALANREAELILDHQRQRTVSPRIGERLMIAATRIGEGARHDGRLGYKRAAKRLLGFSPAFRIAHFLHRRFSFDRPLMRRLADRFEGLLVMSLVVRQLEAFTERTLSPLLGSRTAGLLRQVLERRRAATTRALDALRLQYPEYAEGLERRFLQQTALRRERFEYRELLEERLIGGELHDSLARDLDAAEAVLAGRPALDLGLDIRDMVRRFDLFRDLDEAAVEQLCRLFTARVAVPGEPIVRRGERGTAIYFISSGAVEVVLPNGPVRLGRGSFFGEMALLDNRRRVADVVALGYCHLLILRTADFRSFAAANPALERHVAEVAEERRVMNENAPD